LSLTMMSGKNFSYLFCVTPQAMIFSQPDRSRTLNIYFTLEFEPRKQLPWSQ